MQFLQPVPKLFILLLFQSCRVFQLLCRQLNKQLIAVIKRDFTPHLVNLRLQDLLTHTRLFGLTTKRLFLFQIVINQAISSTLKRVVGRIRPDRVVAAIQREKDVCNILHIQSTFRKVAFTSGLRGNAQRIVNVRFHRIDEIKLNNLEPPDSTPNIELDQQLTLRVVDNHVILSHLPGPHIQSRLNYRLALTCAGYSKNHRIDRLSIHDISAARPLRFILGQSPILVNHIGHCPRVLELIPVLIIRIIQNLTGVKLPAYRLILRKLRCVPKLVHELFINHRLLQHNGLTGIIYQSLALIIDDFTIFVPNVLIRTPRRLNRVQTLVRQRNMRNQRRHLHRRMSANVRKPVIVLHDFFRHLNMLVILPLVDIRCIIHDILSFPILLHIDNHNRIKKKCSAQ